MPLKEVKLMDILIMVVVKSLYCVILQNQQIGEYPIIISCSFRFTSNEHDIWVSSIDTMQSQNYKINEIFTVNKSHKDNNKKRPTNLDRHYKK